MRQVGFYLLSVVMMMGMIGCSGSNTPMEDYMNASFSGVASEYSLDRHRTQQTQVKFNFKVQGEAISGTWSITYNNATENKSGTLAGTTESQQYHPPGISYGSGETNYNVSAILTPTGPGCPISLNAYFFEDGYNQGTYSTGYYGSPPCEEDISAQFKTLTRN